MAREVKANKTATLGEMFETLESRTLMSTTPCPFSVSAPAKAPIAVVKAVAKPAPKPVAPKTPAIVLQADPTLTDPSMKYTSFASDPLFSAAGPKADDVKQGYVGDCYFLSSLSAIARVNPAIIRNDIVNNNDGTYTVKFHTGAKIVQVRVDSDLATWPDGQVAYAGLGAQNCTWVAVMEKAYADFRTSVHSYSSIDGGWMSDAFGALGLANKSFYTAVSSKVLMNVVVAAVKTRQFATFATDDTIKDGAPLVGDHAYAVDAVNYDAKGNAVSIRLRNPWGTDGAGNDGDNDGYVTITATQALHNMSGMVMAHA